MLFIMVIYWFIALSEFKKQQRLTSQLKVLEQEVQQLKASKRNTKMISKTIFLLGYIKLKHRSLPPNCYLNVMKTMLLTVSDKK